MSNLKLNSLGNALNMTTDDKRQLVFGNYRGYNMFIKVSDYSYCFNYSIHIPLKPENLETMDNISASLDTLRSENPGITKAIYENNKLIVNTLSSDKKVNNYQFLLSILNKVVEFANTNQLSKCCESCGNNDSLANLEFVVINNSLSFRCTSCKVGTMPIVRENKSNMLIGTIGALIGAIPGVIIWLLTFPIESLDYKIVAAIGGIVVFGVFIGYERFGKVLDANGKIVCFLLSLSVTILSLWLRSILYIQTNMQMTFSEVTSYVSFSDVMSNELLITYLAVYLLSVAGALSLIRKLS